MIMSFSVYALLDPDTEEIRYIGQTCQALAKRLFWHVQKPSNYLLDDWMTELRKKGKSPIIRLLDSATTRQAAKNKERALIGQCRGSRLLNIEGNKYARARTETVFAKVTKETLDKLRLEAEERNMKLGEYIASKLAS